MKKDPHSVIRKETVFGLAVFLFLAIGLFVQKRGEQYQVSNENHYLMSKVPSTASVMNELTKETLVFYDSQSESSQRAWEQFDQILKDMRLGVELVDLATSPTTVNFGSYKRVIVLVSDLSRMEYYLDNMISWVETGGQALFGVTMAREPNLETIEHHLGIVHSTYELAEVDKIFIDSDFMIGGGRSFTIEEPFESARKVALEEDAKIYAHTDDAEKTPLIWEKTYGEGKFVIDNFGIYERNVRGIYAASISLLTKATVYPVINGATFYIDDFPSPVPDGDGHFIKRDYGMSVSEFYTNVWWPDLLKLHDKYGVLHTGMVIENYEDDTDGQVVQQDATDRFKYFGNSLLANGGEIGYHGYNHQPLTPDGVDYGDVYPNYKTWKDSQAMKNSLEELTRFVQMLFPKGEKSVYVPPSNVLSKEGRDVIVEHFPEIKSIASNYFPGDFTYAQEFQVSEDGIVEQPRIVSGAVWDDFSQLTVFSELNMHYVMSHFIHPDDVLDEDRGAALGWRKLYQIFEKEVSWVYQSAPMIRNVTGSQLAGAVQRFGILKVHQKEEDQRLKIELENFHDQAYLMVRLNQGKPGEITNGKLDHLTGNLYLLKAEKDTVFIELKE